MVLINDSFRRSRRQSCHGRCLKLAKAFVGYAGEKRKLFAVMREFEAEMFERAEQYARKTWDNMQSHFSANGARDVHRC